MIKTSCVKCKAKIRAKTLSDVASFTLSKGNACYSGDLCNKCEEGIRGWALEKKQRYECCVECNCPQYIEDMEVVKGKLYCRTCAVEKK